MLNFERNRKGTKVQIKSAEGWAKELISQQDNASELWPIKATLSPRKQLDSLNVFQETRRMGRGGGWGDFSSGAFVNW